MKKADNIFVRAKAYVKEHPRTSFQVAIQKVKGKKVSGIKAKPKAKVSGSYTSHKTASRSASPKVSGTRKRTTAKKVGSSSTGSKELQKKNAELLSAYMRIDGYEQLLSKEKRIGVKKELITKINHLHDKVDRLKSYFVTQY